MDALGSVIVLGVLGTGIAYILIPVVAVLFGMVTLGESLSLRVLAGMLVVLAGVGLVRRTRRPVAVAVPQASVDICSPGRWPIQCSTPAPDMETYRDDEGC